jgi:hypothetical protein
MGRFKLNIALFFVAIALTANSFFLVCEGATNEPYMYYSSNDAFDQLIVASVAIAVWFCYAAAIVVLVGCRQISAAWLGMLLWCTICVFYLSSCPLGYLDDLERFILHLKE